MYLESVPCTSRYLGYPRYLGTAVHTAVSAEFVESFVANVELTAAADSPRHGPRVCAAPDFYVSCVQFCIIASFE